MTKTLARVALCVALGTGPLLTSAVAEHRPHRENQQMERRTERSYRSGTYRGLRTNQPARGYTARRVSKWQFWRHNYPTRAYAPPPPSRHSRRNSMYRPPAYRARGSRSRPNRYSYRSRSNGLPPGTAKRPGDFPSGMTKREGALPPGPAGPDPYGYYER